MSVCPLCGGADALSHFADARDVEYRTTDQVFRFRECGRCDVLFVDPMLADALDRIYPDTYYSFGGEHGGVVARVKLALDRRFFRPILAAVPGDELALLDVGGGSGWMAGLLRACDPRIRRTVVVDVNPGARAAAEAAGHEFVLSRIEEVEGAGRFDCVLMLNLIEHVADPRALLRKVRELLTDGGVAILKTPNYASLDARIFRRRDWGGFHTPRHFVLFRKRSLLRLAEECGLAPARFHYTQGAPFWATSVLAGLARLGLVEITPARPAPYHPAYAPLAACFAAFDFARKPFGGLSQMFAVLRRAGP